MVAASNVVIFTVISDMTMSLKNEHSDMEQDQTENQTSQTQKHAQTVALTETHNATCEPSSHFNTYQTQSGGGSGAGGSFEFVRTIGVGSFGKIHVVRYQAANVCKPLALKQIAKSNLLHSKRGVESAITERYVLHDLRHPFLMSAHETWQDMRYIYFVMDFASGGDIFSKLQQGECFSEKRIQLYVAEIALAVDFLHSRNIIYRDMKAENVLIDSEGHIRLTDFGLSKYTEPVDGALRAYTLCGTPEYLAPEVIEYDICGYGPKADWWAVGVLMYEMMYGTPPFYDENADTAMQRALTQPVGFPDEPMYSPESMHFVSELLEKDENKRLGNNYVFAHVFLNQLNLDDVYDRRAHPEYRPTPQSSFDCSNFDATHEDYVEKELKEPKPVDIPGFTWLPSAGKKLCPS